MEIRATHSTSINLFSQYCQQKLPQILTFRNSTRSKKNNFIILYSIKYTICSSFYLWSYRFSWLVTITFRKIQIFNRFNSHYTRRCRSKNKYYWLVDNFYFDLNSSGRFRKLTRNTNTGFKRSWYHRYWQ